MCFGKPKVDKSIQLQQQAEAEAARKKEEERQARIQSGTQRVNKTFSQFDDNFYDQRRNDYMGFYQPQLDDQFNGAKDQLTFALARAGTLNSTTAADKQADLLKKYDTQRATILSQGEDQVNSARQQMNAQKSSLISQLNATGDADQVANQALAQSQQLYRENNSYSPLGDIFAGVASGIGNYMSAQNNTSAYNSYFGNSGRSGGKARIV